MYTIRSSVQKSTSVHEIFYFLYKTRQNLVLWDVEYWYNKAC